MTGRAEPTPPPPPDLAARLLPLADAGPGVALCRIHRTAHAPVHFSPGPGKPPAGRFDSPTGRFGVLYAALSFAGAFAEVLLRNPVRTLVSFAEIEARSLALVGLRAEIRLVDLTGAGLSRLGLEARFLSGPYAACGAWAEALHAHPARPAGILYPSRFDPSERCIALFDRAAPDLHPATESLALTELLSDVAAALDRYGKALDAG